MTNNLSSIKLSSNPYTKEFLLTDIKYDNKNLSLSTKFDTLKQSDCIGHFDNYPIIPVSIVMHALSKAASKMLSKIVQVNNPAYFIHFATMEAKKLAFAEDIVNIFVNYFGKFNDLYIFKCSAKNELNEKYGSLLLAMERLRGDKKKT
ncbi:MAG: hypothetical protein OMM_04119 [Candidatus Magnetoglobus multicellularis str. Araruama]|uniref:Uncharacterized protein n=1 Tax=Candidatus Magnetoglobus multicellularis str. Araruama TaxID=890399 RepID=A0A1V1P2N9_9BACT|nr:MAG: hypothetical protein OMM_04119 [Candidatus Magnetoglobus multicellularis str. Araruama]